MKRLFIVLSIILVLALMLSACAKDIPEEDQDLNQEDQRSSYDDIELTPEDAFSVFNSSYPKAKVKKMELKGKVDSYLYEIEGYDGIMEYEVKIDPIDGKIIDVDSDDDNKAKGEILKEDLSRIPDLVEESKKDAGGDFIIKEWELKLKGDRIIFEVELIDSRHREIEYKYDFITGELIEKDM